MRWLALLTLSISGGISGLFLAGCPDGNGIAEGQDGDVAADAAADVANSSSDAAVYEASAFDGDIPITSGGSGALCGANGRDDCGAYALCNTSLGCVECLSDGDCPAARNRCVGGSCTAPCTDAGACDKGTTCDVDAGICAACGPDMPCATGVCSLDTRSCGECASNTDCGGAKPRCRILVGSCVACISNDDCGHSAPVCDPLTYSCRVGCTSDVQCPGQMCDLQAAVCVDVPVDAGLPVDAGDGG